MFINYQSCCRLWVLGVRQEASVGQLEKLCKDSVVHAITAANLVFEDAIDVV
jgi:hypothetical protein